MIVSINIRKILGVDHYKWSFTSFTAFTSFEWHKLTNSNICESHSFSKCSATTIGHMFYSFCSLVHYCLIYWPIFSLWFIYYLQLSFMNKNHFLFLCMRNKLQKSQADLVTKFKAISFYCAGLTSIVRE